MATIIEDSVSLPWTSGMLELLSVVVVHVVAAVVLKEVICDM
jgi:hypothetical protein